MYEIPYTLSELTVCIGAKASPRRHDLVARRLRHWGSTGVLQTVGALHVGTGRSRRFGTEEAYLGALLIRLADWGLSIGALKAIAEAIRSENAKGGEMAVLWREAKEPGFGFDPVFAGLSVELDDAGERPVSVGIRLERGKRLSTPSFYLDCWDSMMVLNLTEIFVGVTLL
jgi:hypothetical protein